jgi:hypothetical protein
MRLAIGLSVSAILTGSALALPPGAAPDLKDGANHRIGDDSFVAAFGRAPTGDDAEPVRMRAHLSHVRAVLAAKPATRPELQAKRDELLRYLDDYIAKGTTPQNTRLPWRTPVFIDDFGNICAVGYLIERSVGRALPEAIASEHRYDFLEAIAAAMPEVQAWVEASGFTLEELASIQPGYEEPVVESWQRWNLVKLAPKDGKFEDGLEYTNITTQGAFQRGRMEGKWTRRIGDKVIGRGKLHRGNGTWHSFDLAGKRLAKGPYVDNDPHGTWTFFHPSGNVAATGRFERGFRAGSWKFFYDTRSETPIATGRFSAGRLAGTWKHFDRSGKLLAVSQDAMPPHGDTFGAPHLLEVKPGRDGVRHAVHTTGGVDSRRLDMYVLGGERLYVQPSYGEQGELMLDSGGRRMMRADGVWLAADCQWSTKRKRIARNGDIVTLHGMLDRDWRQSDAKPCEAEIKPVAKSRFAKLDKLLASMTRVRAPRPAFVTKLALGKAAFEDSGEAADGESQNDVAEDEETPPQEPALSDRDLPAMLAAHMSWYVEWPHVDGRFVQVFYTLAGHGPKWTENYGED